MDMDMEVDNQQAQVLCYIVCLLQSVLKSVETSTADTLTVVKTEIESLLKPVLKVKRELKAKQAEIKTLESDFDAFVKEIEKVIDKLEDDFVNSSKSYLEAANDNFRGKVTQGWLDVLGGYEKRFQEIFNRNKKATSK
jgi:hypothetical protein